MVFFLDDLENIGYDQYEGTIEIDTKVLAFRNAVSKLSKNQRQLINLIIEGYSTKEIVKKTEYNNSDCVKANKYRAIKNIKKILDIKKPA